MRFFNRKTQHLLGRTRFGPKGLDDFSAMFEFDEGAPRIVSSCPNGLKFLTRFHRIGLGLKIGWNFDSELIVVRIMHDDRKFRRYFVARRIVGFKDRTIGTGRQANFEFGLPSTISGQLLFGNGIA